MKKPAVWCVLLAELLILLCGCQTAAPVEDSPAPQSVSVSRPQSQPEQSQPEPETRTAVLCINYIGHPILRIVQRGFSDSAQQLGYEWHVVGLADGSSEQMHAEWLRGVEQYDADGALCWVGDDSGYEFLKKLHGMGVKTAVLHFPHPYADTKEFIDVNVYPNLCAAADDIAEFMVRRLHDAGVYSGSIGITISGSGCCTEEREETRVFRAYMEKHYPEYTVLKGVLEGVYTDQGQQMMTEYFLENPDLVAVLGSSGGSAQFYTAAKQATGRDDIVAVAYDYSELNLELLDSGGVDALLAQPLYEEAWLGVQLIDQMLNGQDFAREEYLWRQGMDVPLIYRGGSGKSDPAYYAGLLARAQAEAGE